MIPRRVLVTILVLLAAVGGMFLYGVHLRRQALEMQQHAARTRPVAPPVSGPTEHITIFTPDDDRGSLERRELNVTLPTEPTMRAREIVHALIDTWQQKDSRHPIGSNADVKAVFLLNDNKMAVVDVNAAFAEQHRSGILVEELTMASLARTLGANVSGLQQIKVIVEGRERETLAGHADLTDFYSTSLDWKVEQ